MLSVWIRSPSTITSKALGDLVGSFGYEVKASKDSADLALWLLPESERPYPVAPPLPTLLLLPGDAEAELDELARKGYRVILRVHDDREKLKEALAALAEAL